MRTVVLLSEASRQEVQRIAKYLLANEDDLSVLDALVEPKEGVHLNLLKCYLYGITQGKWQKRARRRKKRG